MQRDKYSVIHKQITLINRPFSDSKMHCYSVILKETDKWLFKVYGKTRKCDSRTNDSYDVVLFSELKTYNLCTNATYVVCIPNK